LVDYDGDSEEDEEAPDTNSAIEIETSEPKSELRDLNTPVAVATTPVTVDTIISTDGIDEEVESPNKRAKLT
jgi:hypothetical protein